MSFYDYCNRKRLESKQKYLSEGKGLGAAIYRGINANAQRDNLRMRVYKLISAISASNYCAAKKTHRNSRELVGVWAEDMKTAEQMETFIKGSFDIDEFMSRFGCELVELESDYSAYIRY